MRPSRGMGDILPSKMPGKKGFKTIKKRDGNNPVDLYKKGGAVKACACGPKK